MHLGVAHRKPSTTRTRSIFQSGTSDRNKTGRGSIAQPNARPVPHVCVRVSASADLAGLAAGWYGFGIE
jgi:hypothetical protein